MQNLALGTAAADLILTAMRSILEARQNPEWPPERRASHPKYDQDLIKSCHHTRMLLHLWWKAVQRSSAVPKAPLPPPVSIRSSIA